MTRRQRRSLSDQGGSVEVAGAESERRLLERALLAGSGPDDHLTHGFHTYPARMHPGIARAVVEGLSEPGQRVLDPFCGSGTVLVEALCAGRAAVGVDLSPLALRVAEVHCHIAHGADRARFEARLERIVDASLERVRARVPARAPLSAAERAHYEPHVLIELAGLFEEIARHGGEDRRALEMVASSLLVKLSRQRSDTAVRAADKRIRKGLASELMLRKGRELSQRWAALHAALPPAPHAPELREGDARRLGEVLAGEAKFDLCVSSPPYGGTYDYLQHHARRYAWLGLDSGRLQRFEVGARRRLSSARGAPARWDRELGDCLRSIASRLRPSALLALLLGDAELAGRRVDAAEQVARLAPQAGLSPLARASQRRQDWRGGKSRREHLLLLTKR
ncbi:MAG: site-specific DNA-methyltransferase [Myxococcales bacterium]|nr:site-specific DNA-methyltransferase [Myxococcales bacterium]